MLKSLHISNYALIDSISIDFCSGLNIITGETGGGKSIMLGALSLLLGGRADLRGIRHSDVKSVIEAEFDISGNDELEAYCKEADMEWDGSQMILRREISPSGRSRLFVNDSPVTLDVMKTVGNHLVDIHSQHQNRLLSDTGFQLSIIDTIAGNAKALELYKELYADYRAALHRLKLTRAAISRDRENADFMMFQLQRLDALGLKPDEVEALETDRERLGEAAEMRGLFDDALGCLADGEVNAESLLSSVAGDVTSLETVLPQEANVAGRLDAVRVELSDICDTLRAAATAFPPDAASELEMIDARISEIEAVVSRHNVSSANELLESERRLRHKLERLEDAEGIIADLEKVARKAKKAAVDAASAISESRRRAASEFAVTLHEAASPLGMNNLVCDIAVEPADLSATGADKVEFRFAFNKNQLPVPVGVAASGGEISRLMLCIKFIIAHKMSLPTIIFDEVDTGVSGDVADRMGRMMRGIASERQVITITHLPQVAAKGERHFKVYKRDTETSTVTNVKMLDKAGRVDELAMMLSGESSDDTARRTAEALLGK